MRWSLRFAALVAAACLTSPLALASSRVGTRFCLIEELEEASKKDRPAIESTLSLSGERTPALLRSAASDATLPVPDRILTRVVLARPCCAPVETSGLRTPAWSGSPFNDPYVTRFRPNDHYGTVTSGFSMTVPRTLGVQRDFSAMRFMMPTPTLADSTQLAEALRIPDAQVADRVTLAGEGGFSTAYFVHPPPPPELRTEWAEEALLRNDPTLEETLRKRWAAQNSQEVVKVRRSGKHTADSMALGILRDVAVETVASQLADSASFLGEPLVRVARWRSSEQEILQGVIRQEVMSGPRVLELEAAAHTVISRKRGTFGGNMADFERARTLLAEANLSAEQAMERINALEEFYRRSHEPVIAYLDRNDLGGLMNRTGAGTFERIGLDYNHGRNVAWSPTERRFVIFDW